MWTYRQSDGWLLDGNGARVAQGYSGHGVGRNNPDLQWEPNVGPIPVGVYSTSTPIDSEDHGPFTIPLIPEETNQMFGRSGFLMHGDSVVRPGEASKGCIIMSRPARVLFAESKEQLQVV